MRRFVINVNGNAYEVEVDELEAGEKSQVVIPQRPAAQVQAPAPVVEEQAVQGEGEIIESPMPGSIFKLIASKGDMVKSGDVIMILEAMKMENEIVAPKDGQVVDISVSEGQAVDTGDQLAIIQ